MTLRRFRAALPHELDGPPPDKHDLPVYIERVKELQLALSAATGELIVLRTALRQIAEHEVEGFAADIARDALAISAVVDPEERS